MRWCRIREANTDPELRKTFERYGTVTMQMLLANNNTFYRHQGNLVTVERYLPSLLDWLTEQYDRAERKETWFLTMEVAITVFVILGVVVEGWQLFCNFLATLWLSALHVTGA